MYGPVTRQTGFRLAGTLLGPILALAAVAAGATVPAAAPPGPAAAPVALVDGRARLETVSATGAGLTFRWRTGGLAARAFATGRGDFAGLALDGARAAGAVGEPALPVVGRLLAVPPGAGIEVTVVADEPRRIDLAARGLPPRLLPVRPPRPRAGTSPAPGAGPPSPLPLDEAAYRAPRAARPLARVVRLGAVRGVELARLEIAPVAYLPAAGALEVHERLEVRVDFTSAGASGGAAGGAARLAAPLAPTLSGVAGLEAALGEPLGPDSLRCLVVVTAPEFVPALAPLLSLKAEEGYEVVVGEVGGPELGATPESIRQWIVDLYAAAAADTVAGNEPGWLLLVGDAAQVPAFVRPLGGGVEALTDRPYATVDQDSLPDLYWGRLSVETLDQLEAVVAKTAAWERLALPDLSFLGRSLLVAGADDYGFDLTHGNGQIDYGLRHYFDPAHGIEATAWLQPAPATAAAQILAAAGRGAGLINYTGHGSPVRWRDPLLTRDDVRALGNEGRAGIVVANGCATAAFGYHLATDPDGECLAETWLRVPDGGATAYVGATADTYWDEDFWWAVGTSAVIDTGLTLEQTGTGAYDRLFHDAAQPVAGWAPTVGALVFAGDLAVLESGSPLALYYWDVYEVIGDPTLPLHWRLPRVQAVGHPDAVATTAATVPVAATVGARVGLAQAGIALGAAPVGDSGLAEVRLRRAPAAGVPLRLTVTGQNLLPYAAELLVSEPHLAELAPDTVDALVATDVTVSVRHQDGSPWPQVAVWAEQLGYRSAAADTTAQDGTARIAVACPCGPEARVVGRAVGADHDLFRLRLVVRALPAPAVALGALSAFGQPDTLTTEEAGRLRASGAPAGCLLLARGPDGQELSAAAETLLVAPARAGTLEAAVALAGHDLVRRDFPVTPPPTAEVLVLGSGSGVEAGTSALAAGLRAQGRTVLARPAADVLPAAWPRFRLLAVACGAATDPLGNPAVRAALVARAAAGGGLLVEGGGVAAARLAEDPGFAAAVLGAAAWEGDDGGHLYVVDRSHPLASRPDTLPTVVLLQDLGPGGGDVLRPAAGWQAPLAWTGAVDRASVLALPRPDGPGGQVVHLALACAAMTAADREALLANVVAWLRLGLPQPTLAGPLSAVQAPGEVRLAWSYRPELCDGFHLERRRDGEPYRRLTGSLLASADGRLAWRDPVAGLPDGTVLRYRWLAWRAGVEIARGPETVLTVRADVPAALDLRPPRPNPFNPTTTLDLELARPGRAVLRLYDARGRLVRTLLDGPLPAGRHSRRWDGRDDRGRPLPSGLYLARLTSGPESATARLVLVR